MARVPGQHSRLRRRWLAIPASLAVLAVAVAEFASPFQITGVSMASTVQSGQIVLVDRLSTAIGDQRGEVILFYPPINSPVPYLKRVIGLAGDHISIVNGRVSVNGSQLDETYLAPNTVTLTDVSDYELTVPAGTVFVLGDDRSSSRDSRDFGPVPTANVIGQVWMAFMPNLTGLSIAIL